MTKFQQTPFDNLILDLWRTMLKDDISDLEVLVIRELKVLRTIYLSMLGTSIDARRRSEAKAGVSAVSEEELIAMSDVSIQITLNYTNFISQINQLGRLLGDPQKSIPDYNRIRFYRNKVVEHWDEYLKRAINSGVSQRTGKIAIPSSCGESEFTLRGTLRSELMGQLKIEGGDLELDQQYDVMNPCDIDGYSSLVYEALEQIDPDLSRKKIANGLVELLFEFGFPRPIDSVEDFSEELVASLSKVGFTD